MQTVGTRGGLRLAQLARRYDKVIVQFHPDYFYPVPSNERQRTTVSLAYAAAFRRARIAEVLVHEVDYRAGRGFGPAAFAARTLWGAVDRIVVHTEAERSAFAEAFGVALSRITVTDHGRWFRRHTRHNRASARRSLALPVNQLLFLCIGFIQPHKGFDRAVHAFAGLGAQGARLAIVGSLRVDDPSYVAHAGSLQALVESTQGAVLRLGYVSDELFDRWIVAADAVVLPYRTIWSSSVLERAALYQVPVIAMRIGGLEQQASTRAVTFVDDDAGLRRAMWQAAGASLAATQRPPWPNDGERLVEQVQDQVRRRAAAARGFDAGAAEPEPEHADGTADALTASAPVRSLNPVVLPGTTSPNARIAFVKRTVRRLTAWELEPVVAQVNALRAATIEAVERSARKTAHEPEGQQAPGHEQPDLDVLP
jgi:glycosyltransferase involved in cell wall biosynthesis